MIRKGIAAALAVLALSGCGGDKTIPKVDPQGTLFIEPTSFCLPSDVTQDTLFLQNISDLPVTWTARSVPAGSTNLDREFTVEPGTVVALVWTWTPPGSLPAADSLVAETTDLAHRRVVIPFRKERADYLDIDPPTAPTLALPLDAAVFHPGDSFGIQWSRVSDCSGIAYYQFHLSDSPSFTTLLLSQSIAATAAVIEVDPGDADLGTAYWRVRARDNAGLTSSWSAVRSWTITPAME